MNKYLFLLDELPPTKSANGICVEKVISKLTSKGLVYCITWGENEVEGVTHYQIPQKKWNRFSEKMGSKTDLFSRGLFFAARCLYLIKRNLMINKWPVDSKKTAKDFYKKAISVIEEEKITHVIAVNFPGETFLAMKHIKRRFGDDIKTIMYPLDITLNGHWGSKGFKKKLTRWGGRRFFADCVKYADVVLTLENAKELIYSVIPEESRKKCKICGIPLVTKLNRECEALANENEIRIVFAGNLFWGLRDPSSLLKIIDTIKTDRNVVFDFYGKADEKILKEWEKSFKRIRVIDNGWVTQERIDCALVNADILLNIGNKDDLIPSKLFKYMSAGKPIIHLTSRKDDPCIPYLKLYENAIIVYDNDIFSSKNALIDFIFDKHDEVIDISDVFKTCTPEYTAELIANT